MSTVIKTRQIPDMAWGSVLIQAIIPIAGVLLWGWEVSTILVLFWLESIIIWFFCCIKMYQAQLMAVQDPATGATPSELMPITSDKRWYYLLIITLIFFISATVHWFLINKLADSFGELVVFNREILFAALFIFIIQGIDYFQKYYLPKIFKTTAINSFSTSIFLRIFALQYIILGGGRLVENIGNSLFSIVGFVFLKTMISCYFNQYAEWLKQPAGGAGTTLRTKKQWITMDSFLKILSKVFWISLLLVFLLVISVIAFMFLFEKLK